MLRIFIESAIILFREGLEAVLLVASIASYLNKLGAQRRLVELYLGAMIAIVASAGSAWLFDHLGNRVQEVMVQAITTLVAAASMLLISGWLIAIRRTGVWQVYLTKGIDYAASRRTGWAILGLSFLVVFREGAEAILFIAALTHGARGQTLEIFAGLITAALILAALFLVIQVLARRTTLQLTFLVTSFLFFVMAIKFIGEGIGIFQDLHVVSMTPVAGGDWLVGIGFNPSWEAVIVQCAIVSIVLTSYLTLPRTSKSSPHV